MRTLLLIAALLLAPSLQVSAGSVSLSDQQIQDLKSKFLSGGGGSASSSSSSQAGANANDIARDQLAVQPRSSSGAQTGDQASPDTQQFQSGTQSLQPPPPPSAIEISMRARIASGFQISGNDDLSTSKKASLIAPGQSLATPGQSLATAGQSLATAGQSLATPGQSFATPGQSFATPGQSFATPGQSFATPGQSFATPGQSFVTPGQSDQADMSEFSKKDAELRTAWDRFLENPKVRDVDSDISQFGYQLFAGTPNTFFPAADIPVPPEYILGPGDELQMQLYGSRDDSLSVVIDRNGIVEMPKVGALRVAGLSYVQAKALIAEQFRKKAVGVTPSITMGQLRSIRVFVLGDVEHPGSYLVSGLSTISHALFAAGGVSKSGSLRHIQLKRNGKTVQELDLYDFLLKGDSRFDERLMPGDVVFIPPIGPVVGVAGEANRPAIYELKDEKSVQDMIKIAGGVQADADVDHMQIDRLNEAGDRVVVDVGLNTQAAIQNGDILMLYTIPGLRTSTVSLLGSVKRPGQYGWYKGMKLTNLLHSLDDLTPGAFLDYALIQHTDEITREVSTSRISLDKLLIQRDAQADVLLNAEDRVYVFAKSAIAPSDVVSVSGQVVNPGSYPYGSSMHVLDLLFAGGGPTDKSYLQVAELTRYEVIDNTRRKSEHFKVDLADALAGKPDANIALKPYDELFVRAISNWRRSARITLKGEIRHPGSYPVEEGEHLSSVLERAGGYENDAYLPAAVFTRESVRDEQQKELADLARRTEAEISSLETAASDLKDEILRTRQLSKIESAKRVVEQLKSAQATGRIVIKLTDIDKLKGTDFDLTLRDGDQLIVPKRPDEVLVLGEVYNQTAFIYQKHSSRNEYLKMAGGATRSGDLDHVYIVRANGMIDTSDGGWFNIGDSAMQPGDAIVVPQNVDQFNLLDSTLDWSRVLMQVGISVASMKTIGAFK